MIITNQEIKSFIDELSEPRKSEILILCDIMQKVTKKEPKLWGTILGFGSLHYKYPTGREGDMPIIGLASRKNAITLYLSYDIEKYEELKNLGKYTHGKGCLYIKKLTDVNLNILEDLISHAAHDVFNLSFMKDNEKN
ncbi:MAG: DUF1801 domain-containing protein [Erysipelotrichia bacterium]|nr:DUF1801 domain-containing protein [Erysipelotrichia bacterium]